VEAFSLSIYTKLSAYNISGKSHIDTKNNYMSLFESKFIEYNLSFPSRKLFCEIFLHVLI